MGVSEGLKFLIFVDVEIHVLKNTILAHWTREKDILYRYDLFVDLVCNLGIHQFYILSDSISSEGVVLFHMLICAS